jgi:Domain of unknown function (DUF4845)
MRKQRGVTMIGWIFLLVPVAIVLYAGIRVIPEYLNHYKLVTAMKETATKLQSDETVNPQKIRAALGRRFDTGYVDSQKPEDLEITKSEGGWDVSAEYEVTVPLFGNLYLLMDFNETVQIVTN